MPKASSERGDICGSRKSIPLGFGSTTALVGDHICHFYQGEAERFGVLGPYVAEGIRRGDKVLVVVDEEMANRLGGWLASQGVDAHRARKAGQLLQHSGEATKEDMRALFERVEADSLAAGYKVVRSAADMGWALAGRMPVPEMLRWEALSDEESSGRQMVSLCQFDLTRFRGRTMMEALRAHRLCLLGHVLVSNRLHVDPKALLR